LAVLDPRQHDPVAQSVAKPVAQLVRGDIRLRRQIGAQQDARVSTASVFTRAAAVASAGSTTCTSRSTTTRASATPSCLKLRIQASCARFLGRACTWYRE
jgi:hypothetical protein